MFYFIKHAYLLVTIIGRSCTLGATQIGMLIWSKCLGSANSCWQQVLTGIPILIPRFHRLFYSRGLPSQDLSPILDHRRLILTMRCFTVSKSFAPSRVLSGAANSPSSHVRGRNVRLPELPLTPFPAPLSPL